MAIYHTRVKTFSRANGHSSTAAAAYRAGLLLVDETTGVKHDYRRRGGVVETCCFAPLESPDWALEPSLLWSQTEAAERRKDSTVAREFEVALPHELTDTQRSELVGDIARELVGRYGFALQASIHEPGAEDGLNFHAHILATTRRMRPEGLKDKTRELDGGPSGKAEVEWVRQMVADRINEHMALAGVNERVDHRTLQAQADEALARGDVLEAVKLERDPTENVGKDATALYRRGVECKRMEKNDDIRKANEARFEELAEAFAREGRLAATSERHSHDAALADVQGAEGDGSRLPRNLQTPAPIVFVRSARGSSGARDKSSARTDIDRQKRIAAARVAMIEAARIWLEDIASSFHANLTNTSRLLRHQAERVAHFVESALFRADVRDFMSRLKQFKDDALRFARSMMEEDHAAHAFAQAKDELAEFDEHATKPSLWSRRQWAQRRRRYLRSVEAREAAYKAARSATGPEAQTDYQQRVLDCGDTLEALSRKMLERYPVEADAQPVQEVDAAPSIVTANEGLHIGHIPDRKNSMRPH